jgi:hypothetical protein
VRDGVLTSLHVYPVSLVAAFTDDLRAATGPATAG